MTVEAAPIEEDDPDTAVNGAREAAQCSPASCVFRCRSFVVVVARAYLESGPCALSGCHEIVLQVLERRSLVLTGRRLRKQSSNDPNGPRSWSLEAKLKSFRAGSRDQAEELIHLALFSLQKRVNKKKKGARERER